MSYIGSPATVGVPHVSQQLFTYGNVGVITAVLDCVTIISASVTAGVAYHLLVLGNTGDVAAFAGVGSDAALLFVLLAKSRGMYRSTTLLWGTEWHRIVASWGAVVLAVTLFLFLLKIGDSYSRGVMVGFAVLGVGPLLLSRAIVANRLRSALARGRVAGKRAIVVGEREELDHQSDGDLLRKYSIREVGRFHLPQGGSDSPSVLDDSIAVLSAAIDKARNSAADVVLLAMCWTDKNRYNLVRERLRELPIPVVLLPDRAVRSILAQPMAEMGPDIAVQVQRAPLGASELALKRAFDVVLASIALTLLMPLLLTAAAAVKLTSRGPVIFKQDRRGFNGRKFTIYKFRTMSVTENGITIRQAQRNDSRITSLGARLRSSSIDELPQLINVLRGEMSLVGPRPHAIAHDEEYSKLIGSYPHRHLVKPGITGWAQVNGCRGETTHIDLMKRRVDLDLWYVGNWSIWLDLVILARTCLRVARDPNAY